MMSCQSSPNRGVELHAPSTVLAVDGGLIGADPTSGKLFAYDADTGDYQIVIPTSDELQIFEYGFGLDNRYYTSGSSLGGDFRLLERTADGVIEIGKTTGGLGLFPLAYRDDTYFFTLVEYEDGSPKATEIVRLEQGTISTPEPFDHFVTAGVLDSEGALTYLAYDEAHDRQLVKQRVPSGTNPSSSTVGELLSGDKLLSFDGQAHWDGTFPARGDDLICGYFCGTEDNLDMVVETYLDADEDLVTDVSRMSTGELLERFDDAAIGIGRIDDRLMIMTAKSEPRYVDS